jgi:formate hydrogenlyase transcriptional activator
MAGVNTQAAESFSDSGESVRIRRLSADLFRELSDLPRAEVEQAVARALADVESATASDKCRLLEFDGAGRVAYVHGTTVTATTEEGWNGHRVSEEWLVRRLARGQRVSISRPDELPPDAVTARERARDAGGTSIVGLPWMVSGRPVCALTIDTARTFRRWPEPLIDALQQLTEVLGDALQRRGDGGLQQPEFTGLEPASEPRESEPEEVREPSSPQGFDEIVGASPSLHLALSRLAQVAPMNSSVLLLGPTGSGKELFARALHDRSRRQRRPLVRVNCAALPPTLVESELFGHEKGAFTGAVGMRQGRFEMADGGTIFLDEIGDLPLDVQVKFLRVLQEGEFERVGSSHTRKVDVRVIAATHHDLAASVRDGSFRADLYYRLSVYPITLPSLSERAEDVPRLTWFFIRRHERDLGRRITEVPAHVMTTLQRYPWPGNVRELENVIVRAMIASPGNTLQLDAPLDPGPPAARPPVEPDNLDAAQRAHIELILQRCCWRINGVGNAADCLGIHPNTLRFRMKKLGIVRPRN